MSAAPANKASMSMLHRPPMNNPGLPKVQKRPPKFCGIAKTGIFSSLAISAKAPRSGSVAITICVVSAVFPAFFLSKSMNHSAGTIVSVVVPVRLTAKSKVFLKSTIEAISTIKAGSPLSTTWTRGAPLRALASNTLWV